MYSCSCLPGYVDESSNCTKVGCSINNGGCQATCTDAVVGPSKCSCNSGYTMGNDYKTCNKDDLCLINNGGCPADSTCTSSLTTGAAICTCNAGYSLSSDLESCIDISSNLCHINNGGCNVDSICTASANNVTSCLCKNGEISTRNGSDCSISGCNIPYSCPLNDDLN